MYPLLLMYYCLNVLGCYKVFTTLDANFGYWKIPVAIEDHDKTTFTMQMGTKRYTRIPFGLIKSL